ncbi:hypothetical protein V6Z12_D08G142200 [Gossypium hirsutum]
MICRIFVLKKLFTCQTYTDKEGIRQQQLLAFISRHHKHYILPNFVSKKVHFSPQLQTDPRQKYLHAKSCLQPSDTPASNTLSWHLSSETKSTLKGTSQTLASHYSEVGSCMKDLLKRRDHLQ